MVLCHLDDLVLVEAHEGPQDGLLGRPGHDRQVLQGLGGDLPHCVARHDGGRTAPAPHARGGA